MFAEILKLKNEIEKFNIKISDPIDIIRKDLFFVDVSIQNRSWKVLIDDEYQDFSNENNIVNWFLVLHSLELYNESEDFLNWSKQHYANNLERELLDYYKSLGGIYKEIEDDLGGIDTYISVYDYNMRTDVIQSLLNFNN